MKTQKNTRNKALILTASLLGTMFIHTSGNARETKLVSEVVKKSAKVNKAKRIAKAAGKALVPVGVFIEGALVLHRSDQVEAKVEKRQITRKEAEIGYFPAGATIFFPGVGIGGDLVGAATGKVVNPGTRRTCVERGDVDIDAAGKWIGEKSAKSSKNIRDAANWMGQKMNNACDSVTETATAAGNQIKRSSQAASREIQKGRTSVKNCFTW